MPPIMNREPPIKPERHPELANLEIVETVVTNAKNQALGLGESVVKGSLASLVSICIRSRAACDHFSFFLVTVTINDIKAQ